MIATQQKSARELGRAANGGKEHAIQIEVSKRAHDAGAIESERYHRHGKVQGATDHVALPDIRLDGVLNHLRLPTAGPEMSTVETE